MLACFVSAGLGIALGAYAMRILYGDPRADAVRPAPARPVECPACPPCPVCPPPPECEDGRRVPSEAQREGASVDTSTRTEAQPPGPPGVALSAVQAAEAAVLRAVRACEGRGSAVLELTVTVTSTTGRISDVVVTRARLEGAGLEACLERAARSARFDTTSPEGSSVLEVPVELGEISAPAEPDDIPPPD